MMVGADHLLALPPGYRLHEYRVVRVLGTGGFGITYLGEDEHLAKPVAIKEYLPAELAGRTSDSTVVPKSGADRDAYRWGLERFLDEARVLARFDHRSLVRVYRFFEAHGTGYIVMEYVEGETLSSRLKRGPLDAAELRGHLTALLDGLEQVHAAGFLHRDIKPGNIMLRPDGSPVLLDFGSARQAVGARSKSVTAIVTPGYAPIEQYSTRGNQGPWTDLYALGAVGYAALTGRAPPDATDRVMGDDPHVPTAEAAHGRTDPALAAALDRALQVDGRARPQSVAEWRAMLIGERAALTHNLRPERRTEARPARASPRLPLVLGAMGGMLVAAAAGVWGWQTLGPGTRMAVEQARPPSLADVVKKTLLQPELATPSAETVAAQANPQVPAAERPQEPVAQVPQEPPKPGVEPRELLVAIFKTVNLRAGPGTDHQVVASICCGVTRKADGELDGWYRLVPEQPGDASPWVSKDFAVPTAFTEVMEWRAVEYGSQDQLRQFLARFPDGAFHELAQERLRKREVEEAERQAAKGAAEKQRKLVSSIQGELKRLGAWAGTPSGDYDLTTQTALRQLIVERGLGLPTEASEQILSRLRSLTPDQFLAFGRIGTEWYLSVRHASDKAAMEALQKYCKERGNTECADANTSKNMCFSVWKGVNGYWTWAVRKTVAEADELNRTKCEGTSSNCHKGLARCADGTNRYPS